MTRKTYRQEEDGNANDEDGDDVCGVMMGMI